MFTRWRRMRADRRRWAAARTLADLGGLMALWLEGELSLWPGYTPGYGPDEETADLVPVLARANRAGFVTDQSQPGCDSPGHDGRRWEQRAAVSGLVGDDRLLFALARVAEACQLTFLVRTATDSDRPAVTVTKVDGEPYTAFGAPLTGRDLRRLWQGVSAAAIDEIGAAWQVTLADPHYGPSNRLWTALADAVDLHDALLGLVAEAANPR
ncbi:DUF6919 domain-containing protein [Streptomyces sp. NPDC001858]